MQLSTQGLVLHTTPYGETSLIAKVLTRELGLRSYIVKSVRTTKARTKQNLFQPMTRLDMVVYNNQRTQLNYIKELSLHSPLPTPQSPIASAIRFFMAEVLYRSLHEEEPLPALFDYTAATLDTLPAADLANLPIRYMLGVARHLGIEPMDNRSAAEPAFSLDEGRFISPSLRATDATQAVLDDEMSHVLHLYLATDDSPKAPLATRNRLLNSLIDYYGIHLATFGEFKSHEILHTVLN